MEYQVTLNIPEAMYRHARRIAKTQGVKLENVLVGVLRAHSYDSLDSIRTAQNFNSGCLDTGSNAGFVT